MYEQIESGAAEDFELMTIWKKGHEANEEKAAVPPSPFTPLAPWKSRGRFKESVSEEVNELMSRCLRSSPKKDLTIGFFVACFKRRE